MPEDAFLIKAGAAIQKLKNEMKVMDSRPEPGADRRRGRSHDEDLQQRREHEGMFSCLDTFGPQYLPSVQTAPRRAWLAMMQ